MELNEFKTNWKERQERKKQEEKLRREEAWEKAKKVSAFLKDRHNVKQVYLFGSLAWGKHFTPNSDIDLLVVGFPKDEDYWCALGACERIAIPFPLSLVLAESAMDSLVDKAMKEGIEL